MGTRYQCKCRQCEHEFFVQEGEGMYYQEFICKGCGKRSGIPRHAPRPPRAGREIPPYLQTSTFKSTPPIAEADVLRFSESEMARFLATPNEWPKYGEDWEPHEIAMMLKLKNPCECGDAQVIASEYLPENPRGRSGTPHPMTRCPHCREQDFAVTGYVLTS